MILMLRSDSSVTNAVLNTVTRQPIGNGLLNKQAYACNVAAFC